MITTLWGLALAAIVFFGLHLMTVVPGLRASLRNPLTPRIYRAVFSVLALASFVWMIVAYNRAPLVELWTLGAWARIIPLVAMPVAFALLALVYAAPDQAKIVMRHPMAGAVALWALAHILPNGDAASLLLFGGFALFVILDMPLNDARVRREEPEIWAKRAATTSTLPFVAFAAGRAGKFDVRRVFVRGILPGIAVFLAILFVHEHIFGLPALP